METSCVVRVGSSMSIVPDYCGVDNRHKVIHDQWRAIVPDRRVVGLARQRYRPKLVQTRTPIHGLTFHNSRFESGSR
jgi:hypothetical protein